MLLAWSHAAAPAVAAFVLPVFQREGGEGRKGARCRREWRCRGSCYLFPSLPPSKTALRLRAHGLARQTRELTAARTRTLRSPARFLLPLSAFVANVLQPREEIGDEVHKRIVALPFPRFCESVRNDRLAFNNWIPLTGSPEKSLIRSLVQPFSNPILNYSAEGLLSILPLMRSIDWGSQIKTYFPSPFKERRVLESTNSSSCPRGRGRRRTGGQRRHISKFKKRRGGSAAEHAKRGLPRSS